MGFWASLFGKSPGPARPATSAFEQAAIEEAQRRRRVLEQGPRATAEQLEEEISGLRSINQLQLAYSRLRHSDFCDAIAEAVRRGNFSRDDATHAIYVREWVSSGGAWKASFPDWLASDGQQHISSLNAEWLRSGEKHISFNHWVVGGSTAKVVAAPTKPLTNPPTSNSLRSSGNTIERQLKSGKWRQEGSRLVCEHSVIAVLPEEVATSMRLVCSVSRYLNGTLDTNLRFELTPYLYLLPDGEPFEPPLIKAPFALGLVADGAGRGTESDPLIQGGVFEVNASAAEDAPETAMLGIVSSRDTMLAVRTLGIGSDLTLTLMDYDAEPPVRLRLRLPGDPSFARLYNQLRSTV